MTKCGDFLKSRATTYILSSILKNICFKTFISAYNHARSTWTKDTVANLNMVFEKPSLPPTINLSRRSIWSPCMSLAAEQASGVGKSIPFLGGRKKLSFQQCSTAPLFPQGQLYTGTFAALLVFDLPFCLEIGWFF